MKKLLMALVLLPMTAAADGDFTWVTKSNGAGTVAIVGIDGWPKGAMRIPQTVDGKTVTELGSRLFADRENITEVVIPDTVIRVGASLFGDSSVERVTLPRALEEIACGDEQLYLQLTTDGLRYSPGDWKTVGGWGIFNADRLKSLSFSGGRASNDAGTYYIKDGMLFHRLTLDASAQGVPPECRTVVSLLGITGSGRYGKLTVPDGVNGIVAGAFEDLEGVTELSLPSSLVALGGGYGGGCAFGWMVSLSKIVVRGSGSPYQVIGNSLVDTRTKTLVVSTENTVIPADGSITKISRWAFSAAPEKVVIPDCVTDIAPSAFCCANFIRRIEVGAGAVNIMGGAFANIGGLEELVISERNPKYDVVNDCVVEKTELRSMITTAAHPKHYKCQYQGLTYYEFDCHVPYFCRGIVDSAFKDESFVRTVILPKEMQYVPMIDYYNETVASYSDVRRVEIADCSSQSEMEASRTYRELNDQFWDHTEEFEGFYWTEDPQVAVRAIGRVVADGFGRYAPGATVTLTANAIDAGCSVRWRDANGKSVGTGPTFSFTMPAEDVLYSVEPISVAEGAYNWDVSENDDGTVTIRGVVGTQPTGELVIPSTYEGKLVKQVGTEEGIGHGQAAFANCEITSLVVSEGVEVLCCDAFRECTKLTSVKLPSTLKVIRDNCFEDCTALKSIVLPEGLERVEHDFLNRTAVSTLNIPSSLVEIEEGALAIPSGRKFTVAEGNPRYRVENGYVYDYVDKVVFMRADYSQKTFVIPDGAVRIAECCFGDCDGGNITVPSSVREIGEDAFCACQGLTVTFLGGVPQVTGDDSIFNESTNVKVYVQPGQGWDDVVRQGTWQGVPIAYAPGAVSYWYNFNDDGGITLMRVASGTPNGTWVLPSTYDGYPVTAIGNGFPGSEKESLATEVIIPASVRVIDEEAFDKMPKLKGGVLNEGLEEIGRDAFLNGSITSVRIPSTVVSMGSAAFGQNPLTKIEVAEGNPRYKVTDNGLLIDTWEKKLQLSIRNQGKLVIPEGVEVIGCNSLEMVKLSSVTFPQSLRVLEDSAFGTGADKAGNFSFTEVDFSRTRLRTVGGVAFWANTQLKTVRFPATVEALGYWTFAHCSALTSVFFNGGVPEVREPLHYDDDPEWLVDDVPGLLEYPDGDIYIEAEGNPPPRLRNVTTYVTPDQGWEEICESGTWQGRPVKMKTSVTVMAGEGGTATGGGSYDSGAKVSLKATPAAGYVFAGWYEGGEPLVIGGTDYRTPAATYLAPARNVDIVARFATKADDEKNLSVVNISPEQSFTVDGEWRMPIEVDSLSLPVVTVSGLPTGLAFDAKALVISGKPTKPGKYAVKVSLRNTTVTTAKTLSFEIVVPNIRSALVTGGIDYASDAYNYVAGTSVEPILPELAPGCTLTASGLPAGLKLAKEGDGYAIAGVPTAKAGSYTVTLNIAQGRAKDTATITVNVADLPAWAYGDFAGLVTFADGTHGTASLSVSAQGKVTNGKLLDHGTNWTFAANGYDAASVISGGFQEYVVVAEAKSGRLTKPVELYVLATESPDVDAGVSCAEGFFGDEQTRIELWRDVWKDADAKAYLAGIAGKYTYFLADGTPLPLDLTSAGALSGKANVRARDNASVSFATTVFASTNGVEAAFYVAPDERKGYAEICGRFVLDPRSGAREEGVAHRAPGVIALPESWPGDSGTGSVSVTPKGGQVDAGKTVTVSATPDAKSVFVKWRYEVGGEVKYSELSKLTLEMDGEHDVEAYAVFRSKGSFAAPEVTVEASERAKFAALELGVRFSAFVTVEDVENMKPVKWSAQNLPAGLKINAETGEISGVATAVNAKPVVITATSVADPQKKTTFALGIGAADDKPAALPETAVGTFAGFVTNGTDNVAAFTFTSSDKGALSAKVVDASGTVSFSGAGFVSSRDGKYGVKLETAKGERLTLTLDSAAGWDADQLTGTFATARGTVLGVTSQRNAFSKAWYFAAAEGDATAGWAFAFTNDAKAAALTVTLKADGSTAVAGALPNGEDVKGKVVALKVSASGYANVGGMRDGAIIADFAPVVTVNKVKKVLSLKTNLWFDRSNSHEDGAGSAVLAE